MRRFDNGLTQNIGEAAYRGVGLVVGAVKREGDRGKRRKTRGRRIQRSESSAYADDGAHRDPIQLIDQHEPDEFIYDPDYLGVHRTRDVTFIQIVAGNWRDTATKKALYKAIVDRQLTINNGAHNHGAVQHNPAYAGQVDIAVALPHPEPEPQQSRYEIRTPRQDRNSAGLMTDPNRQHLRDGHDHREDGHGAQ
jgi:hypothetical protein